MRLLGRSALVSVLLVVVGCGAQASPAASSPAASGVAGNGSVEPSVPPSASVPVDPVWLPEWAGDDVPDEVANRSALPFCGVERPPQPQPGEFIDRVVRLCFWDASVAGTPAEFVSIQTTMEGDPIATIYRIENGQVTVLTDFTQDRFGGGGWILTRCASVVEGDGDALLGVADCDEGVPLE